MSILLPTPLLPVAPNAFNCAKEIVNCGVAHLGLISNDACDIISFNSGDGSFSPLFVDAHDVMITKIKKRAIFFMTFTFSTLNLRQF